MKILLDIINDFIYFFNIRGEKRMRKKQGKDREPKKNNNISPSQLKAASDELEVLLSDYVENHKDKIQAAFKK